MYWELWLSQVTASAALQCMLVRNKGGQVLNIDTGKNRQYTAALFEARFRLFTAFAMKAESFSHVD